MTGWLDVTGLLGLVAGASYWLGGMRSKELALDMGDVPRLH